MFASNGMPSTQGAFVKPLVVGHRGGFKPENTLKSFQQAKTHRLPAVELDIWLTKDHQFAIIHGGQNGEMPSKIDNASRDTPELVYNLTLQEIRDHYEQTQAFKDALALGLSPAEAQVPTLQDVFQLLAGHVIINIEVKTPRDYWLKDGFLAEKKVFAAKLDEFL